MGVGCCGFDAEDLLVLVAVSFQSSWNPIFSRDDLREVRDIIKMRMRPGRRQIAGLEEVQACESGFCTPTSEPRLSMVANLMRK